MCHRILKISTELNCSMIANYKALQSCHDKFACGKQKQYNVFVCVCTCVHACVVMFNVVVFNVVFNAVVVLMGWCSLG